MLVVAVLLYAGALVTFLLAALGVTARVNLLALGLACWVLVPLIRATAALGQ